MAVIVNMVYYLRLNINIQKLDFFSWGLSKQLDFLSFYLLVLQNDHVILNFMGLDAVILYLGWWFWNWKFTQKPMFDSCQIVP